VTSHLRVNVTLTPNDFKLTHYGDFYNLNRTIFVTNNAIAT